MCNIKRAGGARVSECISMNPGIPEGATCGGSGRICLGALQLDIMLTDIYNPISLTKFPLTILIDAN
jgi:hypothetical protein